jgi:ABC-type bacteriocin/lantibiotic exporter with double-glycine peptidase domain
MIKIERSGDSLFKIIRFFGKYYKTYRIDTILTVLFQILQKITILLIPLITKKLLDLAAQGINLSSFTLFGFVFLGISLLFILFLSLRYLFQTRLETKITNDLKYAIAKKSLSIPYSDFLKKESGYFIQRINKDTEKITGLIISDFSMLCINIVYAVSIIILMFTINRVVSMILITMFPLFFFISRYFIPKIQKITETQLEQEEVFNSQVNEMINANYFIRAANRNDVANEKTSLKLREVYKSVLKKIRLEIIYDFFLVTGIMNLSNVLIYWLGGYFVFNEVMTFGSLTALSLYFSRLWSPIEFFMDFPKKIKKQEISLNRIRNLLDSKEVGNEREAIVGLNDGFETLRVKNLSFTFEERPLFEDLSFNIQKGDKIGILGENGSGKTTLLNILIKLYADYDGEVYYNDIPYRKIRASDLREKVILIPQELYLFEDKNKSGGEKKILQIAEGLSREGDVYLFDEPLAYVDKGKKKNFMTFLRREFKDRTFLIISHDEAVFSLCNKLYKIQDNTLIQLEGK